MTMSPHRALPPPRYRPRYGRMAVLGVSLATTAICLLGGLGVLPTPADADEITASPASADLAVDPVGRVGRAARPRPVPTSSPESSPEPSPGPTPEPAVVGPEPSDILDPEPPANSGEGRRVVFSESDQRVWLIDADDVVRSTYLVSGSLTDNLQPGSYEVFSRSQDAYGIEDSGTMRWFVRFTRGPSGAAIGFHDIPVDDGAKVQTRGQLGTEQSHGCIRQKSPDAKRMWAFAPLGTDVVVV